MSAFSRTITRELTGLTERLECVPAADTAYRATLRLKAAYVICGLGLPKLCI